MKAALCTIAFLFVFDFCWSRNAICQEDSCEVDDGLRFDSLNIPPAPVGTCLVMGNSQYSTFDGGYYNFMGTCTYTIAKNCIVDDKHPAFQINIKNDRNGNTQNTLLSVVTILVYGNTITFNRLENGLVWINGLIWNLPASMNNGRVKLRANGLSVTMQTDFGLWVQYDWDQYLVVTVPERFKGKMCGMCGNYYGEENDDLATPGGTETGSSLELGKSWRVPGSPGDAVCQDGCLGQCPGCGSVPLLARLRCRIAPFLNEGPWSKCKNVVSPKIFYENCLYRYCTDKNINLCQTAKMYSDACERAGVRVEWRLSLGCPNPKCPANSHFEACACPASCAIPTPDCEAYCVEGCTCDKGYLWSGNKCVLRSECGCLYKNAGEERYLQAGESIFVDENCSKKCTCRLKNVEVVCENTSCPVGRMCAIVNGTRGCQEIPTASCSIYGDPHYNTFDNRAYDFQGTCTYAAAQSCHLEGTRLTPFAVTVENEKWRVIYASPNVAVAKAVAVEVYGMTIVLRRTWLHRVMVDGILTNIPVSLHDGEVIVQQEGNRNVIITKFGLRVAYDMVYGVLITVPGMYSGKTCGLCGNFNGNKTDDFQLPDGRETNDIRAFGAAWKKNVSGVVCDDGCSADSCPMCPEGQLAFEKSCSILTDPEGSFAACHRVIDPKSYFRDCVYDACITKGDQLCHSVTAYMIACQILGIEVKNWRTSTFCPLPCPANSVYDSCVKACDVPCPGLSDIMKCDIRTCAEGCVCASGFFNSGSACVAARECGCFENGHAYKVNETVISNNCKEQLTCLPSGKLSRESISCDFGEVCEVRNGVGGCYPRQCLLQAGGSFKLFSGETSTITSVGAYELVRVCPGTFEAEWFRVVVVLGPRGSVLILYVFFEEVFIAVSDDQTIWINGKLVALPQQLKNEVMVQSNEDTLTIEKKDSLSVSFSLSLGLTLSVNEKKVHMLCGACGSNTEVLVQHQSLQAYLALWIALDFPSVPC